MSSIGFDSFQIPKCASMRGSSSFKIPLSFSIFPRCISLPPSSFQSSHPDFPTIQRSTFNNSRFSCQSSQSQSPSHPNLEPLRAFIKRAYCISICIFIFILNIIGALIKSNLSQRVVGMRVFIRVRRRRRDERDFPPEQRRRRSTTARRPFKGTY